MRIEKGARRRPQIKPYVMEAVKGPVEVADLFFEDGTTIRQVPFEFFRFVASLAIANTRQWMASMAGQAGGRQPSALQKS
jgi:hypothetical protein